MIIPDMEFSWGQVKPPTSQGPSRCGFKDVPRKHGICCCGLGSESAQMVNRGSFDAFCFCSDWGCSNYQWTASGHPSGSDPYQQLGAVQQGHEALIPAYVQFMKHPILVVQHLEHLGNPPVCGDGFPPKSGSKRWS